jgi:threonine dehydratase
MTSALAAGGIAEASQAIDPAFSHSPQFESTALSSRVRRHMLVKIETLNPVGSFKGRGADYFMRGVPPGRHVVCASAGNFGQAVAYTGRARGVEVTVFAATTASKAKVARMRELGARVTLAGDDFDAAKDEARAYAKRHPECLFVEDGHDARIAEGAGTIAVEMASLNLGGMLIPVGNGALISGIGCWMKAHSPGTKIIGVCAAGAPAMAHSWRAGRPVSSERAATMADGIAVRVPVPAAVTWMREYVDDVVLVSEESIRQALDVVRDTLGMLVEPSGAVGIAAALQYPGTAAPLATIITGGNLSADLLADLTGGTRHR